MTFRFEQGVPACPIACQYCFITEHGQRRAVWNETPLMGINKASTFVNVPPWITDHTPTQERFTAFPWDLLRGDYVGFTAITDPFWPKLDPYLWQFIAQTAPRAKLVTCVSKWAIRDDVLRRLAQVPSFRLVLGITGNEPPIERITVATHLKTLQRARDLGVPTLPIIHPYIPRVSNLSFLPALRDLGYDQIAVKGLRYDHANMGRWMPPENLPLYLGKQDREVLPEDGWRDRVRDAGFTLTSPRQWYAAEAVGRQPCLSQEEATALVEAVCRHAAIVSSDSDPEVIRCAIARRL